MKRTSHPISTPLGTLARGVLAPLGVLALSVSTAMAQQFTVYLGTYTGPQSEGIYRTQLDSQTGQLSAPELVAKAKNPSFLALSSDGKRLYAAIEADGGAVGAWAMSENGTFAPLNTQPSGGDGACHVWVDNTNKNVLVANYSGGSVAVFPVQADGSLSAASAFTQHSGSGPDKGRQEKPHLHSIYTDKSNARVYACDLGTDAIHAYHFDAAKGTLEVDEAATGHVPPGSGPRHLVQHPNGCFYVDNEMTLTVTVLRRNAQTDALTLLQTIATLPADAPTKGVSLAEIFAHPNGKWLYVSNRGRDTITRFAIGADGQLTWLGETKTPREPRGFALSPDGNWLVVGGQKSNDVAAFRVNAESGDLTPSGTPISVGAPVCVLFAPSKADVLAK